MYMPACKWCSHELAACKCMHASLVHTHTHTRTQARLFTGALRSRASPMNTLTGCTHIDLGMQLWGNSLRSHCLEHVLNDLSMLSSAMLFGRAVSGYAEAEVEPENHAVRCQFPFTPPMARAYQCSQPPSLLCPRSEEQAGKTSMLAMISVGRPSTAHIGPTGTTTGMVFTASDTAS